MKKALILIVVLGLSFFALAVLINLRNPDPITLRFYGGEFQADLFLVIFIPFFIGMVIGSLLMSVSVMKNKLRVGKAKRDLAKVEKEVQNLRAAPITEPMKDEAS